MTARYWTALQARDWEGFEALLAEDVVYELPQTRERIRGRANYLRFNIEYPATVDVRGNRQRRRKSRSRWSGHVESLIQQALA